MLPAAVRCRSSHARTGVTVPCACRYALSATGASPCSSPILHAHASLSVTVSSSGAGAPPSCMHRLSYDICRRDSSSHGGPGTSKPAPMARAAPSLGGLHQWLPSNHHPPEATRASYVQNPPWCHVTTSKYVRSGHLGAMQRVLLLLLPPSQRTAEGRKSETSVRSSHLGAMQRVPVHRAPHPERVDLEDPGDGSGRGHKEGEMGGEGEADSEHLSRAAHL